MKMRERLIDAIRDKGPAFGIHLRDEAIERLADYHSVVEENNALLHLVAPCSAEEFAVRHVLESLALLEHLPQNARFADVGPGGGLPSIPCLLARGDLSALLIESKEKKARFLELAVEELNLSARASVINLQFEEVDIKDVGYVTCRALDKFTERLPRFLKWAKGGTLLLFGGENLATALKKSGRPFVQQRLPLSERRFLLRVED